MCLAARSLAAGIAQLNCAYNALSAIAQLPYGRLVQGQGVEEVMRDVVQECLAVAQASDVTVVGDIRQAVQRLARSMPGQLLEGPSASQDGHDHNRDQLETP